MVQGATVTARLITPLTRVYRSSRQRYTSGVKVHGTKTHDFRSSFTKIKARRRGKTRQPLGKIPEIHCTEHNKIITFIVTGRKKTMQTSLLI